MPTRRDPIAYARVETSDGFAESPSLGALAGEGTIGLEEVTRMRRPSKRFGLFPTLGASYGSIFFVTWLVCCPSILLVAEETRPLESTPALAEDWPTALQNRIEQTIARAAPAVVGVTERRAGGVGSFSGVIVHPEGWIWTAGHAVTPGRKYQIHLADGRTLDGIGKGTNRLLDCAMIEVVPKSSEPLPVLPIGDSSQLVADQPCISLSHPGSYDPSRGAIARLGRILQPVSSRFGMIASTALMEPGDSGGPLIDLEGRLIGIHSQIGRELKDNYDVPVGTFAKYWQELREESDFEVDSIPGLPDLGMKVRRGRRSGPRIVSVTPDGPAARVGLAEGDVIVEVAGKRWTGGNFQEQMVRRYLEGERRVALVATRGSDQRLEIDFPLEAPGPEEADPNGPAKEPFPLELLSPPTDDNPQQSDRNSWCGSEPRLQQLEGQVATVEDQCDDACLVLRSEVHGESIESMGTVLRDSKGRVWLVTKASRIDQSPQWLDPNGSWQPLEVVARDLSDDLVALRPQSGAFSSDVMNSALSAAVEASQWSQGQLLIAPHPDGSGRVGISASRGVFSIPADEGRGFLGVVLGQGEQGVFLEEVLEQSAAEKGGMQPGDVVVRVDQSMIESVPQMQGILRSKIAGDPVRIAYRRPMPAASVEQPEDDSKANEDPSVDDASSPSAIEMVEQEITVRLGEVQSGPLHVAELFDGGKSARRGNFAEVLCSDLCLRPEECGSPWIDLQGRCIAVSIARFSRTRSHAIPAARVEAFLQSLPD
jgi:S1-C subfamily serine protease